MRLNWHRYLDPRVVEHDHSAAAVRDRRGDRLHVAFALMWCFLMPSPTSAMEFAGVPLMIISVIRALYIWPAWGSLVVQPLFLGVLGWAGWQGVTLLWSPDVQQGVKEIEANRWLWVVWALWPVIRYRRWMIAALALGFVCGNGSQVAQGLGDHFGWGWMPWHRAEARMSGWWDPVVGGSLLVGALGLHLPAAVMGKGQERWLGVTGAAVTGAGIVATGTRGAWIAGMALVVVVLGVAAWRLWHGGVGGGGDAGVRGPSLALGVRFALIGAVAAVLAIGFALRGPVERRVQLAREEIAGALERHDYASDTGARVIMNYEALRAFVSRPVGGVGAGGFHAWASADLKMLGQPEGRAAIHAHAHSAPLHIAATTGSVGLLIGGFIVIVALVGAAEGFGGGGPLAYARGSLSELKWGTYDAGPLFAIVGLLLAGLFDPVQLNAQTAAMLATVFAMGLVGRRALRPA